MIRVIEALISPVSRSTFHVNATGWSRGLDVTGGGTGIVSHAGLVLLRQLSDRTGLTAGLPAALPSPLGGHDADILELIPVTIPELLRQLRGAVIPSPAATRPTATA